MTSSVTGAAKVSPGTSGRQQPTAINKLECFTVTHIHAPRPHTAGCHTPTAYKRTPSDVTNHIHTSTHATCVSTPQATAHVGPPPPHTHHPLHKQHPATPSSFHPPGAVSRTPATLQVGHRHPDARVHLPSVMFIAARPPPSVRSFAFGPTGRSSMALAAVVGRTVGAKPRADGAAATGAAATAAAAVLASAADTSDGFRAESGALEGAGRRRAEPGSNT